MRKPNRPPSLWYVPGHLWERIEAIIGTHETHEIKKGRGRPKVDRRRVLDGILFHLRTGCAWNHIPPVYGSHSTLHRSFRGWLESGAFGKIWAVLVEECPELAQVWSPPPGLAPRREAAPDRSPSGT